MSSLHAGALAELGAVFERIDDDAVDEAARMIAPARNVIVFGGGRERLQIMGFAVRLFRLGRRVAVVGDMTTPAIAGGIRSWPPSARARSRPRWRCSTSPGARARRSWC